jgi:DNA-binding transcriptional MerR regulator
LFCPFGSCYKLQIGKAQPLLLTGHRQRATDFCMAEKKSQRKKGASAEPVIPDKLYFRIGEVATLCHLPAYVLRFWETEFPQLKPVKGSNGQRMYRQRDVETLLRIKTLLYDQGFTIAGARQHLKEESKPAQKQSDLPFPRRRSNADLKKVRQGLQEILGILAPRRKVK